MQLDFKGKKIALLTKHGKEKIIAPILQRQLNCTVEWTQSVDTDALGTFDRTIARQGTQLQTLRRKVHLGIDASQNTMGVASEGSFVPDPYSGFMPWNIEMVMFVDDLHGLEVVGTAQGSAMSMSGFFRDIDALLQFAQDAGFPSHALMLRPESQTDKRITKGIADIETLKSAFMEAQLQSRNGKVFVENDLRAFCNPTRQKMIEQATEDLVQKMRVSDLSAIYKGNSLAYQAS
ncbi:MAG: hypothetical protein RLY60_1392 [Pseudomonadota bacterium]|jgi:hypothetical protein|nr:hypothetical protein [Betaproteobacteria bacterium]